MRCPADLSTIRQNRRHDLGVSRRFGPRGTRAGSFDSACSCFRVCVTSNTIQLSASPRAASACVDLEVAPGALLHFFNFIRIAARGGVPARSVLSAAICAAQTAYPCCWGDFTPSDLLIGPAEHSPCLQGLCSVGPPSDSAPFRSVSSTSTSGRHSCMDCWVLNDALARVASDHRPSSRRRGTWPEMPDQHERGPPRPPRDDQRHSRRTG